MAPFTEDSNLIRKSFSALRVLRDEGQKRFPDLNLKTLSMGMSGDFEIAIEEGSTLLRLGSILFGKR